MSGPQRNSYDVVIVGGAMMGAAVAHFLSAHPGFDGRILVVERDPGYGQCSTAHSNSCMRLQFSSEINIRISQFAVDYVRHFRDRIGDAQAPEIHTHPFGYLYLATTEAAAERLRANHRLQAALGAGTVLMSPEELAREFPFFNLEGIVLGSLGTRDEGYFDGNTIFDWWRRMARRRGVEFHHGEVTGLVRRGNRVEAAVLADGTRVSCGHVVNAAGPRAARVAAMAGLDLPVEPRRRYTFVFRAQDPLPRDLPLTVDPLGFHVRTDGANYMLGGAPQEDTAVAPDDFHLEPDIWQERFWPLLASRIPAFEAVKLISAWVGHYAYNRLDQNAIVGPHPEVENFIFVNGFSGHGLQQAPAMGRGVAELIAEGSYRTLDLSPLGYERVTAGRPLPEAEII